MKIFTKLYDKVIQWSRHSHAPYYLAGVSFVESSVFPIPPDVMLIPMCMAQPKKSWNFAGIATVCSTLGGIFGYILGMFFFTLISHYIQTMGYTDTYEHAKHWFAVYGFWTLFIAAFTPVPYKLFTVAAGAMGMALMPFILASLIGRAGRFFLVAAVVRLGGLKMEGLIRRYIDWISWAAILLLIIAYFIWRR